VLFLLLSATAFSQTVQELVIKPDSDCSQEFFKSKGCTSNDGVIVITSLIPNLKFQIPDAPKRLRHISGFDREYNRYVLCLQPTDTKIGGQTQYTIDVTADGYKKGEIVVSRVLAGVVQCFFIDPKDDFQKQIIELQAELSLYKNKNGNMDNSLSDNIGKIQQLQSSQMNAETDARQYQTAELKTDINNLTISGTIRDKKEILIGVNVSVKGKNIGTVSNFDGNFNLSNVPANATLVFNYIGHKPLEVAVNGQTRIDATMQESFNMSKAKNFFKEVGIGITGDWGLNYPSFKNQNGAVEQLNDSSVGIMSHGWKAGIALIYPKRNTTDYGDSHFTFQTGLSFSNNISSFVIAEEKLSNYTLSVPLLCNIGFEDTSFFFKFGVENTFNLNAKYNNSLLDAHIADRRGNRMFKPYSLDGVIGFGFMKMGEDLPFALSFQYTRSFINQLNTNYVHTINGMDYKPFANSKLYNNFVFVALTWFIGGEKY
jgi:hypothetical protein